MKFSYKNIQQTMKGGRKITRKVIINRDNGHKSICVHKNGKKCSNTKKKLSKSEINSIKIGKFIPGLFNDLKSRKNRN